MFSAHLLNVFLVLLLCLQADKKDPQSNGFVSGFEVLVQKQLKGKQIQKEMAEFIRERYPLINLPSPVSFSFYVTMKTMRLSLKTSHFLLFLLIYAHHWVAQQRKRRWKPSCIKKLCGNQTFYFPLRIKIEEEYAKNLSKLSQIHLGGQEEGWVYSEINPLSFPLILRGACHTHGCMIQYCIRMLAL